MSASSFISPEHEAARQWASKGFPVFPWRLKTDDKGKIHKIPCIKDWENAASVDADKLDGWWRRWPDAGVGCPPARVGCFVLDVDTQAHGADGEAPLSALERDNSNLPVTMETLTQSGGRHLWFKGGARNSASAIGQGLDIRGSGGWAALPDNRRYMSLTDAAPTEAPEWLVSLVHAARPEHAARKLDSAVDLDADINVNLAAQHLKNLASRGDVAIEGAGGNDRTYRLAQELQDLGLSPETSLSLMEEHWNPHCAPPWDRDELGRIVDNATHYRQNDAGVKGLDSDGSVFAGAPTLPRACLGDKEAELVSQPRFRFLSESDQDELTEPPWLIPGWLSHGSVSLLYGEPGSYKSFIALDAALSIAAGLNAWGIDYAAEAFPVVYIASEGAVGIAKKRRPAWREHRGADAPLPFWVAPETPLARDPGQIVEFMKELERVCDGQLPRLVVFDTQSRAMAGLDENSAQDASKMTEMAAGVSKRYSCAVLLVHHEPKGGGGPRGSSVFTGNVDTVIHASADKSSHTVLLECEKQKDAEEPASVAFKTRKVLDSLVLERCENRPQFVCADTQLRADICVVLRENVAHSIGSSMTTSALADSLGRLWGEEGDEMEIRKRIAQQLRRFCRTKEGRTLILPHSSPPQWAVIKPIEDYPSISTPSSDESQ